MRMLPQNNPNAILLHPEQWTLIGIDDTTVPDSLPPASAARRRWSALHAHCHPIREILFCLAGRGYFGLGNALYPCAPGTIFIVESQMPHDDFYTPQASGLEHLWIRILGDTVLLGWYRIDKGQPQPRHEWLRLVGEKELGINPSLFLSGVEQAPPAYREARFRLLVGILALTLDRMLTAVAQQNGPRPHSVTVQERVVLAIRDHIERTAGKGVTLDFLAHFSGYSKFHLHRLFRAQTGETIHRYVDRYRQERARAMRAAGMTNKSIADELGFSCATAYLRWRRQQKD